MKKENVLVKKYVEIIKKIMEDYEILRVSADKIRKKYEAKRFMIIKPCSNQYTFGGVQKESPYRHFWITDNIDSKKIVCCECWEYFDDVVYKEQI